MVVNGREMESLLGKTHLPHRNWSPATIAGGLKDAARQRFQRKDWRSLSRVRSVASSFAHNRIAPTMPSTSQDRLFEKIRLDHVAPEQCKPLDGGLERGEPASGDILPDRADAADIHAPSEDRRGAIVTQCRSRGGERQETNEPTYKADHLCFRSIPLAP